ncbi:MAG: hypothetical protein HKN45_04335 [Flavobacteriales bacterium]|nr:hypothetical protein [Flavobacteriales bacterium]
MKPIITIDHRVQLFAQPTDMTCWSAATTMLFGNRMSVGAGGARLSRRGGLNGSYQNIGAFARAHGLTIHAPQSWHVHRLIELLRNGPVVMMGHRPTGHAVVIGAVESDGTPERTYLKIFDPWPVNSGLIRRRMPYDVMMRKYPMTTRYMLQRPGAVRSHSFSENLFSGTFSN